MDGEGGCLATYWVSPQKLYSPKAISNQMNLTETKKTYLIFSGTVPFRNHHGRRWWLFGDMLSIPPSPPPPPPLSGWWWKAAGAKWPRSIQPQSRTFPCILPSCYNLRVFFVFFMGHFPQKEALLCTRNSPAIVL